MALVLVAREHGDRLHERRLLLLPVLLVEALPADAVGHADHRERPVREMRQHERRDAGEVAQQVALGERGLLERRIGRPVDAVEMRQADAVQPRREGKIVARILQLRQHFGDLVCLTLVPGRRRLRDATARVRRRPRGLWPSHVFRFQVVAQAQKHRCAQAAVLGPVLVLDLGHEPRFHPRGGIGQLRLLLEWTGFSRERLQSGADVLECPVVEAGADVGGILELPAAPIAHQQCAQRRARSFSARVSADHEIPGERRLDLQPVRRTAAGFVAAVLALADDAFETARQRGLVQGDAVVGRVHQAHQRRRQQALREIAPPVAVGPLPQIDAAEIEQIEAVEHHGRAPVRARQLARARELHAILERVERRPAFRIERDDLAVQDHPVDALPAQLVHQPRKRASELQPAARAQLHLLAVDEREHAVAVQLGLPRPVGSVEGRGGGLGVHGLELQRAGLDISRGNELRRGYPVRGHHFHVLDRHARKHRAILRRHVIARYEPVLVLDEKPALRLLRAHQRERSLHFLATEQNAQLSFFQPVPDLFLRLGAVVEPRSLLVGRVDAAIPDDHFARAVPVRAG